MAADSGAVGGNCVAGDTVAAAADSIGTEVSVAMSSYLLVSPLPLTDRHFHLLFHQQARKDDETGCHGVAEPEVAEVLEGAVEAESVVALSERLFLECRWRMLTAPLVVLG